MRSREFVLNSIVANINLDLLTRSVATISIRQPTTVFCICRFQDMAKNGAAANGSLSTSVSLGAQRNGCLVHIYRSSMVYLPISPIRTLEQRASLSQQVKRKQRSTMSSDPPSFDMRSPALSSNFSRADTANASVDSNDTGNTTETTGASTYTANTGGRARSAWRHGQIFEASDNRVYAAQSNSAAGEVNPGTEVDPMSITTALPAELPAKPFIRSEPLRTFFESASSSSSDSAELESPPVLSRASSVRVHRPRIVESPVSKKSSRLQHFCNPFTHSTSKPGPSGTNAEQMLRIHLPSNDMSNLSVSSPDQRTLEVANLSATDRNISTTALPPTHPESWPVDILDVPDTPTYAEALDTLPSTCGGLGSLPLRAKRSALGRPSDPHPPASAMGINGLRSNPVDSFEVARLHRAASAPPLPVSRHHHMKVTFRPSDLVITDAALDHHRLFRECAVSTPYPIRSGSTRQRESQDHALADAIALNRATAEGGGPRVSGEKWTAPMTDRFPSRYRSEPSLFLQLGLGALRERAIVVEIKVKDKATFDDKAMFDIIRRAYRQRLLGVARTYLAARSLSHVEFMNDIGDLDPCEFYKHVQSPKIGHRRKTWTTSLRNQHQVWFGNTSVQYNTPVSLAVSQEALMNRNIENGHGVPLVAFHHRFSTPSLMVAVLIVFLLSCLATVCWVLFGLPGEFIGDLTKKTITSGAFGELGWRVDAQRRVMTGLVLGILVLLLGNMTIAAWAIGSLLFLP